MGFQSEEESGESNRKHQMGSELPPLPAAPGAKLSHPTAEEPMGEGRAVKVAAAESRLMYSGCGGGVGLGGGTH